MADQNAPAANEKLVAVLEGLAERDWPPHMQKFTRALLEKARRGELGGAAISPPLATERKPVRRSDLDAAPQLAWKSFVSLVAMSEYDDLRPVQQIGHLAFWYDAEVYNGGHMQYFKNGAGQHWREAVGALTAIGADRHAGVLAEAGRQFIASGGQVGFPDPALTLPFTQLDVAYGSCGQDITKLLETYLGAHLADFVDVIDDR